MSITINGDTGIAGVDGSASTPAVQGNDTNTGMFFPAADTIAFAEGGTEVMRIDSNGNLRVGSSNTSLNSINSANTFGFKNRIINGDFRIDQRNAGASVSVTSADQKYPVDRFLIQCATDGTITAQQSTTVPAGFTNSVITTVSVTDTSLASGQVARIRHKIEGFNVSDLGFGTANAQTITISFWTRSSITGTFGGYVTNSAGTRSYPFSFTISSANTWEQKTITVAGDTTGTWLTNNGTGIEIGVTLGAGSSFIGTANTWASAEYFSVSGAVNLMATSGATFYITGVQLEKGSTATSFDYRPYGTELQLCQRYLPAFYGGTSNSGSENPFGTGTNVGTTQAIIYIPFKVSTRVPPTGLTASAGSTFRVRTGNTLNSFSNITFGGVATTEMAQINTDPSGLTNGQAALLVSNSSSAYFYFNGCEL